MSDEVSEDAVFCLDLVEEGYPLHSQHGRIFLCRPNGDSWDNAIVTNMVRFPDREVTGDEVGSMYSKVWVEPDDWQPLNLEPNIPPDESYDIVHGVLQRGRQMSDGDMKKLVEACSGKRYSEARTLLGL